MSANSAAKVSILMNCYNGERYLEEALDSVVNQTYANWELIFWDNKSTDHSAQIFNKYSDKRFKYHLAERHTTLGAARELASTHLTGEFIAVLDVDDLWLPDKLEKQLHLFSDNNISVVISNTDYFSNSSSRTLYHKGYEVKDNPQKMLLKNYNISLETVLIRKAFLENKIFDSRYSHIADFELIMRALERGRLAYVDQVLAKWRIHESNNSWLFPKRFNQEKRKWIKDKKLDKLYVDKYKLELECFENRLNCSRILRYFTLKNGCINFSLLCLLNYKFLISWAVLILSIMPWRNKILDHFYNKKYLLNDR